MAPFTETVAVETFNRAFEAQYASYGVKLDTLNKPIARSFNRTGYLNMSILSAIGVRVWGGDPRDVTNLIGGADDYDLDPSVARVSHVRRAWVFSRAFVSGLYALAMIPLAERRGRKVLERYIDGDPQASFSGISLARDALEKATADHLRTGLIVVAALSLLGRAATRNGSDRTYLLDSLSGISEAPNIKRQLAFEHLREFAQSRSNQDPALLRAVRDYMRLYGHRQVYEMDVAQARPIEDIAAFIDALSSHVGREVSTQRGVIRVKSMSYREIILSRIVRFLLVARERSKSNLAIVSFQLRITIIEAATRNAAMFKQIDDVFWLRPNELASIETGQLSSIYVILNGRRIPRVNMQIEHTLYDERKVDDNAQGSLGANVLQGVSVSHGHVSGRVRIIKIPLDARSLVEGDIAVVVALDSGWTDVFSRSTGVIAETGGIVSHAAILLRERRIPAIFNVTNATRVLRDGDVIDLDTASGRVTRGEH